MNLLKLLKDGQEYMRICPKDTRFKTTFIEIRIIYLTHCSLRLIPPFAMFVFIRQYMMQTSMLLSIVTVLVLLSVPIHGLLWLGKRAATPLPLTLIAKFNTIKQILISHQLIGSNTLNPPTFMTIMKLLHLTKAHFGDYFYDQCASSVERKQK